MEILFNVGAAFAYGFVSLLLMILGYLMVDLLTPGRLHKAVWEERNRNATLVLSANTLGVGVIIVSAIFSSEVGVVTGLFTTLVYGLVGLVMMGVSFLVIDMLTPGKLSDVLSGPELHPAAWVNAAAHFSVALVMAATIS